MSIAFQARKKPVVVHVMLCKDAHRAVGSGKLLDICYLEAESED